MIQTRMTDEEMDKAIEALVAWFESQGIDKVNGVKVMIRLIVTQLAGSSSERLVKDHDVDRFFNNVIHGIDLVHDTMKHEFRKLLLDLAKGLTK